MSPSVPALIVSVCKLDAFEIWTLSLFEEPTMNVPSPAVASSSIVIVPAAGWAVTVSSGELPSDVIGSSPW